MDSIMENIQKWVEEFDIVRPQNLRVSPTMTNQASPLRVRDSTADFSKLQLSSVLQDISNSLIRGNVDEGTLDLLEILENLLLRQGSVITESHKSAYCWTAAECTLIFMWPLFAASEGSLFADAFERIWKERIRVLKEGGSGLVSDDLLKWETDLEKAGEDPEMYQRIREMNIRCTAVSFLNQLLQEQRGSREDPNAVDENPNIEGVGCVEDGGVNEQHVAEEEQEDEPSLDKERKMAAGDNAGSGSRRTRPGRLRPCLSSTVPLKKTRRANPEEVEVLREGVNKFGGTSWINIGTSWKNIKDAYPVFAERTPVSISFSLHSYSSVT